MGGFRGNQHGEPIEMLPLVAILGAVPERALSPKLQTIEEGVAPQPHSEQIFPPVAALFTEVWPIPWEGDAFCNPKIPKQRMKDCL